MKGIDKRACLKMLEPVPAPGADCGLFLLASIRYVIRTAVKIIGHRQLLTLCFYTHGDSLEGKAKLAYTMFQSGSTFVTYDHNPLAKTRWRNSMLDNLEREYFSRKLFAFYSKTDESRVLGYCKKYVPVGNSDNGLEAMFQLQSSIRENETRQRRKKRERKIRSRMASLRALPRSLNDWILRRAAPAYFMYDCKKGAKTVRGICSACGSEVEITGARHNIQGVCPCCHREFIMKSNAKRGRLEDRVTTSVIQKIGPHELVIRIMKTWMIWPKGESQTMDTYEETRVFVRRQENGELSVDVYHHSSDSAGITPWKAGYPPVINIYQSNFNAETCGALFCPNLKKELAGTPWQYCPIQLFYESIGTNMEVLPFLEGHLLHPKAEHLIKTGFINLAADLVYRGDCGRELNEGKNRTHQILGVTAGDIPFLREINPDISLLRTFKQYCRFNLPDRQALLLWQIKNEVEHDVLPVLDCITPHKMMRYLDGQYPSLTRKPDRNGGNRYRNMQDIQREYRDYLDMCKKEGYDLRNSFVLFPADLQEAHDRTAQQIRIRADAKKRRDFAETYRNIMSQMDFEMDGMKIVYPSSPDEIVAEGHELHHCVGSYVDRVINRECMILFLRRCDEEDKPFYTIEVSGKKVIQVRGMHNAEATPEVKKFMSRWEKKVLRHAPESSETSLENAA